MGERVVGSTGAPVGEEVTGTGADVGAEVVGTAPAVQDPTTSLQLSPLPLQSFLLAQNPPLLEQTEGQSASDEQTVAPSGQ